MTTMTKCLVALSVSACAWLQVHGDTLLLNPAADTRISQMTGEADVNFEGQTSTTIHGSPSGGAYAMDSGLFKFDVSSLPSGVVVTSVTFSIYIEAAAGNAYFNFRELTTDWIASETVWNLASTGNPWTTLGGDVGAAQLGNDDILTSEIGKYQVFVNDPDFVTLVQRWLDDPGTNRGFIMRRTYGNTSQYVKLTTMEGPESQRPILTINGKPLPWPPPGTVLAVR